MSNKKISHSEQQAISQLEHIIDRMTRIEDAYNNDDDDYDSIHEEIQESILGLQVRSPWVYPGDINPLEYGEYELLLCTGGPAVRIIGELNRYYPENARIQHQDWGTPWTDLHTSTKQDEFLLRFANHFYYGG